MRRLRQCDFSFISFLSLMLAHVVMALNFQKKKQTFLQVFVALVLLYRI